MHQKRIAVGRRARADPTPVVPPAPGRLSMTIGCPICADTCSSTMRPTMSLAFPALKGTMAVMVRTGKACARAGIGQVAASPPRPAMKSRLFILCSLVVWTRAGRA